MSKMKREDEMWHDERREVLDTGSTQSGGDID